MLGIIINIKYCDYFLKYVSTWFFLLLIYNIVLYNYTKCQLIDLQTICNKIYVKINV